MEVIRVNNEVFSFNKVWYVSPYGNDITGDGTEKNPLATIQKAAEKCNVNNAIYLMEGNHIYTKDTYGVFNDGSGFNFLNLSHITNIDIYIYLGYLINLKLF